jgi:hypothetical protein
VSCFTFSSRWLRYHSAILIVKKGPAVKRFCPILIFAAASFFIAPSFAQKLIDPNAVSPEFREAAEKRRAEQIRQNDCARKADAEKVMPRERTSYLLQCLQMAEKK